MSTTDPDHLDNEVTNPDERSWVRRRMSPRVASECRVSYETVDELVVAYTEDLSRGGLYVRTTKFLPVGAVVRVLLSLPGGEQELSVLARVAFVLDEEQARQYEREPGMGMGFLDIGGTPIADEIARFISAAAPEAEIPPSPAGMSSRILVVDDDAYHRAHAAELMEESGHEVVTAEHGVEALQLAMKLEPDLVLTDVQMPRLDGWQLVRMLRARPSLAQIPVVFVTSLGSDEQRLQGYRLGVDDYIAKPFNDDEFALRVQRVLDRARAYPRTIAGGKNLRGDLAQVSLGSLLTFLEMEKRTGELLIVRRDAIATLRLRDGHVVRVDLPAEYDDLEGAERLLAALDWDSGRFELAQAEVYDEDSVGMTAANAVLEHARRRDEAARDDEPA